MSLNPGALPPGILRTKPADTKDRKTVRFRLPIGTVYTSPEKRLTFLATLVEGEKHPIAGDAKLKARCSLKLQAATGAAAAAATVDANSPGPKFVALKASAGHPSENDVLYYQNPAQASQRTAPPLLTSTNFPELSSGQSSTPVIQGQMSWSAVVSNPPPAAPPSNPSKSHYFGPKRLVARSLANIKLDEDFPEEEDISRYSTEDQWNDDFG